MNALTNLDFNKVKKGENNIFTGFKWITVVLFVQTGNGHGW